jgi:hypothetical protein
MVESRDEVATSVGKEDAPRVDMPRWVKVSLLVVGALVLVFVLANVTGVAGDHGPGRHGGSDDSGEVDGGGHRSPIDHGG